MTLRKRVSKNECRQHEIVDLSKEKVSHTFVSPFLDSSHLQMITDFVNGKSINHIVHPMKQTFDSCLLLTKSCFPSHSKENCVTNTGQLEVPMCQFSLQVDAPRPHTRLKKMRTTCCCIRAGENKQRIAHTNTVILSGLV